MLDTHIGGYGHGYGHKDHRSSHYGYDEDDSDVEEFYESRRSHHSTVLPHHSNNHRHQPQPNHNISRFVGNIAEKVVTPLEVAAKMVVRPVHNLLFSSPKGETGNVWQGRHEEAYYGRHGMKPHGGHGMQHHGGHGMQHHGGHGMQHHGGQRMKHQDRFMAPQVPPHHEYMNPNYGSGSGRAVMMQTSESWRVSNSNGGHY